MCIFVAPLDFWTFDLGGIYQVIGGLVGTFVACTSW